VEYKEFGLAKEISSKLGDGFGWFTLPDGIIAMQTTYFDKQGRLARKGFE
jgi:hypothetical protein